MDCVACQAIETGVNPFGSPSIIESENIIGIVVNHEAASRGHCIFLPKKHSEKMHEIDDEVLSEIIRTIKKVARAMNLENYNILQNNGAIAFQTLFHAHFHLIPKNSHGDGLRYLRDKNKMKVFDQDGVAEEIIEKLQVQ